MKYTLYFPAPNARERLFHCDFGMLDYIMDERPKDRDAYVSVYDGEIATMEHEDMLNLLWRRHNVGDEGDDNRPRAREIRSMCIGDIVRFDDGSFWVTDSAGFHRLTDDEMPSPFLRGDKVALRGDRWVER